MQAKRGALHICSLIIIYIYSLPVSILANLEPKTIEINICYLRNKKKVQYSFAIVEKNVIDAICLIYLWDQSDGSMQATRELNPERRAIDLVTGTYVCSGVIHGWLQ